MQVVEFGALRQVDGYLIAANDIPIIDAEPVVRCKDCMHNFLHRTGNDIFCGYWAEGGRPADGYCHMGARREATGDEHDDMEISLALLYCRHNDGALCNVCPYAIHEPKCSHRLLTDASRRIRELIEEVKGHEDD